jgi:hypothetical protein
VEFLRYERQCKLVSLERSPIQWDPCVPDVVGVNKTRRVVEIEIKMTMADFRNNRKKDSVYRRKFIGVPVSKYYFMVPPDLMAKVLPELEDGEGLLTVVSNHRAYGGSLAAQVVKEAAVQKVRRLSIKEIIKMVAHQTGSLNSALAKIATLKTQLLVQEPALLSQTDTPIVT